jgi:hypothetical protein
MCDIAILKGTTELFDLTCDHVIKIGQLDNAAA